jgi:hypothetical protein
MAIFNLLFSMKIYDDFGSFFQREKKEEDWNPNFAYTI